MEKQPLSGVIAAIPTPVDEAGNLHLEHFISHAKWVLANGCNGLNVLGTTGEANSLSVEARLMIMEAAAQHLDTSDLMVGTGTPDFETAELLTRHAADLGFAGALILPPYYYKPVSDEALYDWFTRLVRVISKTDIKLYLYNFPVMTGIKYSVDLLVRLAADFPGRICGIKDSSGDLEYCQEIVKRIPGFAVFPSSETTLPTAQTEGYAGCISATVNLTAPLSQIAWQNQDAEKALMLTDKLNQLRTSISATPLVPSIKYLLSLQYGTADWRPVLPPLQPLQAIAIEKLAAVFEQLKTQA